MSGSIRNNLRVLAKVVGGGGGAHVPAHELQAAILAIAAVPCLTGGKLGRAHLFNGALNPLAARICSAVRLGFVTK